MVFVDSYTILFAKRIIAFENIAALVLISAPTRKLFYIVGCRPKDSQENNCLS